MYNGLEAELEACKEGIIPALHRTELPMALEMGCIEAVSMIKTNLKNR